MVSITNNIITDLHDKFNNVKVLREYPNTDAELPCIIVQEGNLDVSLSDLDSGGYKYTNYDVDIDIFTEGHGKISEATEIRNGIDAIMSNKYGLQRVYSQSIPNMADTSVYRYRLSYTGKLDNNKTVYRR